MDCRCLMAVVALIVLPAQEEGNPSPDEIKKAFAWFDTLGYPDLSKARYVRVATGWWSQSGNKEPQNQYREAFLLEEHGAEFKVFMTNLSRPLFTKTPPGTKEHERVAWEPADLARCVRTQIDDLAAYLKLDEKERDRWRRWGERLGEKSELFVLARGCASQGEEKLALELYRLASTLERDRSDAGKPLVNIVSGEIAHAEMWRAVVKFGDPDVKRTELRASFQRIVRLFPESYHLPRAKETAELLDKMVREDEEREKKPKKPWKDMTKAEQAADLVFQLRDQNGQQWGQPGSVDFFEDPKGKESPASKLVELGFDAAPALIEALDDPRFTRSVQCHRDFYFSHHALTVGDASQAALEKIASRDFDPPPQEGRTDAERIAERKKRAQEWWAEFGKKGEKQMLIEGARRGEVRAARRLAEKFPSDALEPIARGARNAEGSWERERLIEIAAKIPGEAASAFLMTELKDADDVSARVKAAEGLLRRGNSAGIPAMIAEWEKMESEEDLISFLANCASRDALASLGRDLSKRSVGRRLHVIAALGKSGEYYFREYKEKEASPIPGDGKDGKPDETLVAVVVDILIAALDDDAEREGMSGSWGGKSYSDPRICDFAGHVLWMRWPKRFTFDLEAPLKERDRQRVELKNVVRKERGLPPLALPANRADKPLALEEVEPLVKKFLEAASDPDRKKAAAGIEQMGSRALPALVKIMERFEAGTPSRELLDPLSIRLACLVEELEFDTGALDPGDALRKSVERFRGRPLDAERMVDLVIQTCSKLPKGVGGLRVAADRDVTLAGVRLKVTLLPARTERGLNPGCWDHNTNVRSGDESLGSSSGASAHDYGLTEECFDDFRKAAEKALAAPPARSFLIKVSQILDPR